MKKRKIILSLFFDFLQADFNAMDPKLRQVCENKDLAYQKNVRWLTYLANFIVRWGHSK